MSNLQVWEEKIKARRMKTPFRDFVKEICSWSSLGLYRNNGKVCRYPDTGRIGYLDNDESQNAGSYFLTYRDDKNFFLNFWSLLDKVPLQYILDFWNNENAEYVDQSFGTKNGYLAFVSGFWTENVLYTAFSYLNVSNVLNSFLVLNNCNNVYFSAWCNNSYNIFYSKYITDSSDIWFCTNMIGCRECIFCNGLQNQKYCFQNKILGKDEYFQIKNRILKEKERFLDNYLFVSRQKPINYSSENITGEYLIQSSYVENGYWVSNARNSRNVVNVGWDNNGNFYDCFDTGVNSSNFYWVAWSGNSCNNLFCSAQIDQSSNIYYSYFLQNCSFCLGCIGLKNKSYYILNKQYIKEEWYELADKIFAQMDADGTLGDFFPWSLNPFYFNDTMAYLIDDSFTKEEVEKEGYMWRDEAIKVDIPEWADIIETKDLGKYQGFNPNGNWTIQEDILGKVIRDEKGNFYKIVPMELEFLRKHHLPLPEIHWLDRIKMGFRM